MQSYCLRKNVINSLSVLLDGTLIYIYIQVYMYLKKKGVYLHLSGHTQTNYLQTNKQTKYNRQTQSIYCICYIYTKHTHIITKQIKLKLSK